MLRPIAPSSSPQIPNNPHHHPNNNNDNSLHMNNNNGHFMHSSIPIQQHHHQQHPDNHLHRFSPKFMAPRSNHHQATFTSSYSSQSPTSFNQSQHQQQSSSSAKFIHGHPHLGHFGRPSINNDSHGQSINNPAINSISDDYNASSLPLGYASFPINTLTQQQHHHHHHQNNRFIGSTEQKQIHSMKMNSQPLSLTTSSSLPQQQHHQEEFPPPPNIINNFQILEKNSLHERHTPDFHIQRNDHYHHHEPEPPNYVSRPSSATATIHDFQQQQHIGDNHHQPQLNQNFTSPSPRNLQNGPLQQHSLSSSSPNIGPHSQHRRLPTSSRIRGPNTLQDASSLNSFVRPSNANYNNINNISNNSIINNLNEETKNNSDNLPVGIQRDQQQAVIREQMLREHQGTSLHHLQQSSTIMPSAITPPTHVLRDPPQPQTMDLVHRDISTTPHLETLPAAASFTKLSTLQQQQHSDMVLENNIPNEPSRIINRTQGNPLTNANKPQQNKSQLESPSSKMSLMMAEKRRNSSSSFVRDVKTNSPSNEILRSETAPETLRTSSHQEEASTLIGCTQDSNIPSSRPLPSSPTHLSIKSAALHQEPQQNSSSMANKIPSQKTVSAVMTTDDLISSTSQAQSHRAVWQNPSPSGSLNISSSPIEQPSTESSAAHPISSTIDNIVLQLPEENLNCTNSVDHCCKDKYIHSLEKIVLLREKISKKDLNLQGQAIQIERLKAQNNELKDTLYAFRKSLWDLMNPPTIKTLIPHDLFKKLDVESLSILEQKTKMFLIDPPSSLDDLKIFLMKTVDSLLNDPSAPSATSVSHAFKSMEKINPVVETSSEFSSQQRLNSTITMNPSMDIRTHNEKQNQVPIDTVMGNTKENNGLQKLSVTLKPSASTETLAPAEERTPLANTNAKVVSNNNSNQVSTPSSASKNKRRRMNSELKEDNNKKSLVSEQHPHLQPKAAIEDMYAFEAWTDIVYRCIPTIGKFTSDMSGFVKSYLLKNNLEDFRLQSNVPHAARFPHAIPSSHQEDFLDTFAKTFSLTIQYPLHSNTNNGIESLNGRSNDSPRDSNGLFNSNSSAGISKKNGNNKSVHDRRKDLTSGNNLYKVNRNNNLSKASSVGNHHCGTGSLENILVPWTDILKEKFGTVIELVDIDSRELTPLRTFVKQFLTDHGKDYGFTLRKCQMTSSDTSRRLFGVPIELKGRFEHELMEKHEEFLSNMLTPLMGGDKPVVANQTKMNDGENINQFNGEQQQVDQQRKGEDTNNKTKSTDESAMNIDDSNNNCNTGSVVGNHNNNEVSEILSVLPDQPISLSSDRIISTIESTEPSAGPATPCYPYLQLTNGHDGNAMIVISGSVVDGSHLTNAYGANAMRRFVGELGLVPSLNEFGRELVNSRHDESVTETSGMVINGDGHSMMSMMGGKNVTSSVEPLGPTGFAHSLGLTHDSLAGYAQPEDALPSIPLDPSTDMLIRYDQILKSNYANYSQLSKELRNELKQFTIHFLQQQISEEDKKKMTLREQMQRFKIYADDGNIYTYGVPCHLTHVYTNNIKEFMTSKGAC